VVKTLVAGVDIPVISNGNVRTWDDVLHNKDYTGASGIMVGETLLENPYLFEGTIPDPVSVSLEYLELCKMYPGTATLKTIQTHIRHFIENQCQRRPWFSKFRTKLGQCASLDEIEALLRVDVIRWRGLTDLPVAQSRVEAIDEDTDLPSQGIDLTGFLDDDEWHDSNSVLELE